MRHAIISIGIVVMILTGASTAVEEVAPPANDAELIRNVVQRLARTHGTSICFEEYWPSNEAEAKPTDLSDENIQEQIRGLLEGADERILEETLNQFVAIAPEYTWKEDVTTGVINVFPARGSRLQRQIQQINIRNTPVRRIFREEDVLDLEQESIRFFPGRGNLTWLDATISLEAENVTTMEALNLIVEKMPFPARWEVFPVRDEPDSMGYLMIRGYSSFP